MSINIDYFKVFGYFANYYNKGRIVNKRKKSLFEARAKILKALAHPTRLFIVEELSHGEKCVRDLTDLVKADISTISKHLSVLKDSGLIRDEKRGLQVFYTLRYPCVLNFFNCIETVIKSQADERLQLLE